MERIVIKGGHILKGTITTGGSKNNAVVLITPALLVDGIVTIKNVTNITVRDVLFGIVKLLNCDIELDGGVVKIDSTNLKHTLITQELSVELRASYYFMGYSLVNISMLKFIFQGM